MVTPGTDTQPAWSFDGKIYHSHSVGSTLQLYVTSPFGTNQHAVYTTSISQESVVPSADGSMIAWSESEGGGAHVYVANNDGSNATRLTNSSGPDNPLAWLPCH